MDLGDPDADEEVIENRRSLLYVGNLCDAITRCLEAEAPDGRTFCVADGAPLSTPQLCRAIGDALGRPLVLRGDLRDQLVERFRRMQRQMAENNLRQAYVVEGAERGVIRRRSVRRA